MPNKINVIDLFAGPGGLGEGFSAYSAPSTKSSAYQIRMSVEKEANAHQTLTLRALYRSLSGTKARNEYDQYITGKIPKADMTSRLAAEWELASHETLG